MIPDQPDPEEDKAEEPPPPQTTQTGAKNPRNPNSTARYGSMTSSTTFGYPGFSGPYTSDLRGPGLVAGRQASEATRTPGDITGGMDPDQTTLLPSGLRVPKDGALIPGLATDSRQTQPFAGMGHVLGSSGSAMGPSIPVHDRSDLDNVPFRDRTLGSLVGGGNSSSQRPLENPASANQPSDKNQTRGGQSRVGGMTRQLPGDQGMRERPVGGQGFGLDSSSRPMASSRSPFESSDVSRSAGHALHSGQKSSAFESSGSDSGMLGSERTFGQNSQGSAFSSGSSMLGSSQPESFSRAQTGGFESSSERPFGQTSQGSSTYGSESFSHAQNQPNSMSSIGLQEGQFGSSRTSPFTDSTFRGPRPHGVSSSGMDTGTTSGPMEPSHMSFRPSGPMGSVPRQGTPMGGGGGMPFGGGGGGMRAQMPFGGGGGGGGMQGQMPFGGGGGGGMQGQMPFGGGVPRGGAPGGGSFGNGPPQQRMQIESIPCTCGKVFKLTENDDLVELQIHLVRRLIVTFYSFVLFCD